MELLHQLAKVGILVQQMGVLVAVYLVLNKYVETLLHEGSKLILAEAHTLETGDILGIIFSGDGHIGEGGHRREFLDTLDGGQVGFFVLEESHFLLF